MENKNLKTISIKTFIHLRGSTDTIFNNFKRLVASQIIFPNKVKLITINYEVMKGINNEAPAKLFFEDGTAVFLDLTAGYSGSGPSTLKEIIQICFPEFSREKLAYDISTPQEIVDIRYVRDFSTAYQFEYEDNYYYAM